VIEDNEIETKFFKLGEDADGKVFEKNERVSIINHPNKELNGDNYLVLRRWEIGYDRYECIREVNGIVQHIVADRVNIKKVKK
jgi:hypothetical protein